MRCRGAGRVHKGPHLLQAPWASLGGSLALRTQREGRDVRAVFIGQLHNYCLPMRRGHSWWWVVGDGGGGVGGEWGGGGQFFFSIRKQHSVDKVHTLRYSVSKIS